MPEESAANAAPAGVEASLVKASFEGARMVMLEAEPRVMSKSGCAEMRLVRLDSEGVELRSWVRFMPMLMF